MRFVRLRRQWLRRGRRWQIRWRAWRLPEHAEWPLPPSSPFIAGLSPEQQQRAIAEVCRAIGAAPRGEIHSGIKRTAISTRLLQPDGSEAWLKMTLQGGVKERWRRQGERLAQVLDVPQPKILREHEWTQDGQAMHAFVYSLASPSVQLTPWVSSRLPPLSDEWIDRLKSALAHVAAQPITRWTMPPGNIARSIAQRFGRRAPYEIDEWRMSHGDLHWSNLSAPDLSLLDWEFFGAAPRGYDAATLLIFAMRKRELYRRLEAAFADDLNTRSGIVARLLAIARRMGGIEAGKSDPRDYAALEREAKRLMRM